MLRKSKSENADKPRETSKNGKGAKPV